MAEQVDSTRGAGHDYLAARQLKAGSASWVLLAGLGVAYVISGDYAGWHFGLAQGGWGGRQYDGRYDQRYGTYERPYEDPYPQQDQRTTRYDPRGPQGGGRWG